MQGFGPVLGIETSCDETAAAIVRLRDGQAPEILSDVIWGQVAEHTPFGGVVPEIAARAHVEKVDLAIAAALREAGLKPAQLAGVAATGGPGLIGGVMVGLTAGKAVAMAAGVPFVAVNHLEGHALSPRLTGDAPFPYLLLLASGGHCQFLALEGLGRYHRLGSTVDDAAGEAFDKAAKLLGLGFPGGPAIEAAARGGDPKRFDLPRPMRGRPGCDLSFAGLKTALARAAEQAPDAKADLAASFQAAMLDVLEDRTEHAIALYEGRGLGQKSGTNGKLLVAAGGVAANAALRARLERLAGTYGYDFVVPPHRFCTDNAAMIALAGAEKLASLGILSDKFINHWSEPPRARWPLDSASALARPTHASGRKGPKA